MQKLNFRQLCPDVEISDWRLWLKPTSSNGFDL